MAAVVAAGAATALDIPEIQVAVDFPGDAYYYHVRILLVRLDGPNWVCCTATFDVQTIDLSDHVEVVPLTRGARFPQRVRASLFYPDPPDDRVLDQIRKEAQQLALVLGAQAQPAAAVIAGAEWYINDMASESFATLLSGEVTGNPARMVTRGSFGLALVEGDDAQEWVSVERVLAADFLNWRQEKLDGPGRDRRILQLLRDGRGTRHRRLRETMADVIFFDKKNEVYPDDWPFSGPSALRELMNAIRASGEELAGFHEFWIRSSGAMADHPSTLRHRDLLTLLSHMTIYDQLNVGQLSTGEQLARFILQIHQAVKRAPKNPDFRGTELMVTSQIGSGSTILTGDFAKYVAEEQKSVAFTMKQHRLLAEEQDIARKREKGGDGGAPPQPKKKDG